MSHEVNNTVAASNSLLHSSLTYGGELSAGSRHDFEHAIGIVIGRTEQLNAFMRRFADVFRLPPPHREPCTVLGVLEPVVRLLSARPDGGGRQLALGRRRSRRCGCRSIGDSSNRRC